MLCNQQNVHTHTLTYITMAHTICLLCVNEQEGYEVISVVGGPVSSSWDRTVEIYTQLVGGTVDYGKAHSEEHGHLRFSESYAEGEEGCCC